MPCRRQPYSPGIDARACGTAGPRTAGSPGSSSTFCRDELRRRARRPRVIDLPPTRASDPAPIAPDAELGPAIARLTTDEQALLALRFGREFTVPEIADQLGLPEGTVKSRLHSTLQHLRGALDAERRAEEPVR